MDNILCWNVRGLNMKDKQLRVRKFILSHQAKLFSLLETRVKTPKLGDLYLNVCPGWCFTTNLSQHKNGRIVVGWDPISFDVDVKFMSSQMVHCFVTSKPAGHTFWCSFIYGHSDKKDREALWKDLSHLATSISMAWVIMGDFNAIMAIEDRVGSLVKWGEIQPMRSCMSSCNLAEVKTMERHFTWTNKQDGAARVFTRIDRILANSQWEDIFTTAEATYFPEEEFDHCPMIMSCYRVAHQKKPFRFYNMWVTSEHFIPTIQANWSKPVHGCHMFRVVRRLKWIKADLKLLNKNGFSSVEADNIKTHNDLVLAQNALHGAPMDSVLASVEKAANEAYRTAHHNYLSFLQQTAKLQWLQLGNEAFFT
ncbi:uncharacterized protein [Spinacia oleracea]|uniref:Endonuclease/exonuclease/phosphatase domain-containing protein n=1 Tax=Spinacia oleracea TaxID=3562 RepID=A0A9R0I0A6_SPIOL|nr:uncharacterized protein LOC110779850 [Spinacia oleracea]